jgi:hypothetical protein
LSKKLFYSTFGIKPDTLKILSGYIYPYDHVVLGIPKHSVRMKFWWRGMIYKGILDLENEVLRIKEPLLIPVFDDILIPGWKEITKVYANGTLKEIEFYDDAENLQRAEYLDKDGIRKNRSWKKFKGVELHWNSRNEAWVP